MINVTNGGTNGGSNTITFNPRDSIEIVSWTDDAGTHARLFGHNERDDALVGVPADARRASFSSAAVVELLLKQAGLTAQTIFAMIEEAHAKHPACAIILNGEQEVAIRKAIRNSGGGDIVPMRAFGTAPTYTGLAMKPSCGFIAIADAPILGVWAGATLIAEHVAEQRRLTGATAQAFVELEAVTQAFGVNSVEAAEATERAKKAVEAAKAAARFDAAAASGAKVLAEIQVIRRPEGPPLTVVYGDPDEARKAMKIADDDARERGKLRETLLVDIIGQLRHHAGGEVPNDVRVAAADALGRIGTALAAR